MAAEPLKELYVDLTVKGKDKVDTALKGLDKELDKRQERYAAPSKAGGKATVGGGAGTAIAGKEAAGAVGEEASAAAGVLAELGPPLLAIAGAYASVKVLEGVAAGIIGLAGKANPYVVERLNLAWDDMLAVIGHSVIPIVDRFTQVVRMFGDFLATVMPSSQEVEAVMKDLNPAIEEFRQILVDLAPFIRDFLTAELHAAAAAIKELAHWLHLLREFVRDITGGWYDPDFSGNQRLKSSRGAAARPAAYLGLEELSKQAAQMSYSVGTDPAQRTADNTQRMGDIAQSIYDFLNQFNAKADPNDNALRMAKFLQGLK